MFLREERSLSAKVSSAYMQGQVLAHTRAHTPKNLFAPSSRKGLRALGTHTHTHRLAHTHTRLKAFAPSSRQGRGRLRGPRQGQERVGERQSINVLPMLLPGRQGGSQSRRSTADRQTQEEKRRRTLHQPSRQHSSPTVLAHQRQQRVI